MEFEKNVFVNCPFDEEYTDILRPVLFCILALGFDPRIALERSDSGESRISKIVQLIYESKFGIHDLSRLISKAEGELFRLNMPFELGVDYGCRTFKEGKWKEKKILILESEKYRFQAALSDLSGSDIAVHENDPVKACNEVRNWLNQALNNNAPGPSIIWGRFNEFMGDNFVLLTGRGYSKENIEAQPIGELINCMREWLCGHQISTQSTNPHSAGT